MKAGHSPVLMKQVPGPQGKWAALGVKVNLQTGRAPGDSGQSAVSSRSLGLHSLSASSCDTPSGACKP